jgi:hypothetical protein
MRTFRQGLWMRSIGYGTAVLLLVAGQGLAEQAAEETTLEGEVVDPALYLREERHGAEAEDLMYEGIDGGQTMALLQDGTNALYLFLAGDPGEDPNDLAYEYIARRVKVTGVVYERGGLKGVVVSDVAPLESGASQPSGADSGRNPSTSSPRMDERYGLETR